MGEDNERAGAPRLANGLAEGTDLRILARRQESGREISQPSRHTLNVETGPPGHAAFAVFVLRRLLALRVSADRPLEEMVLDPIVFGKIGLYESSSSRT